MRLGREAKSKVVRVPVRLAPDKLISETIVIVVTNDDTPIVKVANVCEGP